MHFLLTSLLPSLIAGAAITKRQNNDAYSWSPSDVTYDGEQILGSFNAPASDASSPGITQTNNEGTSGTVLQVTVQNLLPSVDITSIFAAVHSDNVRLFEVGKPVSQELATFINEGSNDFTSVSSQAIFGTRAVSNTIGPGQYLNFTISVTLPSNGGDDDDDDDDDDDNQLANALDDAEAVLTLVGRVDGVDQTFVAVNAMDLGDENEMASARLWSIAPGFLTASSGYVNADTSLPVIPAAYVLTYAPR